MTGTKLERNRAHRAKMLASIVRRLEQCQATANMYGLGEAEAALSTCLRAVTTEVV